MPLIDADTTAKARRVRTLEGLLLLQLLAAPVLPLAFPLLYATLGLLHLTTLKSRRVFLDALPLLLLGMLLSLSAFLAGGVIVWDKLGEWLGCIGLAWGLGREMTSRYHQKILRGLVFSGIIWMAIGFAQVAAGVPTPSGWLDPRQVDWIQVRSYSVFGNPNIYALYLLSLIPMAGTLVVSGAETAKVRSGAALVMVTALAALATTYSRSGWLVGAVMVLGPFWGCLPLRRRFLWGGIAGLGLSMVTGIKARLVTLFTMTDSSALYRFRIWKGVYRAWRENWVWGIGPGGFAKVYPWFQVGQTPAEHAHSFYLQFWLEYGLIGMMGWLFFCGFLAKQIRDGWENPSMRGIGLAWFGFLGIGLGESWQDSRFCTGFFWVLTGLILAMRKKEFRAE